MKKKFNKILAVVVVALMCVGLLPISALAGDGVPLVDGESASTVEPGASIVPEEPTEPTAEEPAEPTVEEPTEPTAEEPTEPATEEPVELVVEEPDEPTAEEPTEPAVEAPAEPTEEEPVVSEEEPTEPVVVPEEDPVPATHVVKFWNAEGDAAPLATVLVPDGQTIVSATEDGRMPAAAEMADMVFDGWYAADALYDETTVIANVEDATTALEINLLPRYSNAGSDDEEEPAVEVEATEFTVTYHYPAPFGTTDVLTVPESAATPAAPLVNGTVDPADYGMVTFRGWFLGTASPADDVSPYSFDTLVTGNIDLYAVFSATYLVSYKDSDVDGNVVQTDKVAPETTIYGPTAETLELLQTPAGTRFDYWVNEATGARVSFPIAVTSDLTFIPHFTSAHIVSFVSGGTYVAPQFINDGEYASKPSTPLRTGFRLLYWADQATGEEFDFENTPITRETILVAEWEGTVVKYSVAIWMEKANFDGTPTPGNLNHYDYVTTVSTGLSGEAGKLSGLNVSSLPSSVSSFFATTMGNGSVLKYAAPQAVADTELQGNGMTVINLFATRKLYTFTYNLGDTTTYRMTYKGSTYNGGSSAARLTLQAKYEQDVSDIMPWPNNINATFYDTANNRRYVSSYRANLSPNTLITQRMYVDKTLLPTNGNAATIITFNASWTTSDPGRNYRYFVELLDGESVGERESASYNGKTYVLLEEYNQASSTSFNYGKTINGLSGQNTSGEGQRSTYNAGSKTYSAGQGSYYCYFYKYTTYTLTFNKHTTDTVTGMPANRTIPYGHPVGNAPADVPVRAGFIFAGWYKDADLVEPFDFTVTMPSNNMVAYASWESDQNKVTLLDGLGGTVVDIQGVATGYYAKDKSEYWKRGDFVPGKGTFVGWRYTVGTNGEAAWSWDTVIEEDWTLYAKWETTGYTIGYDLNGGTGTQPVDSNLYAMGKFARVLPVAGGATKGSAVFYAWKDSETGKIYYPGDFIDISENGNVTLVAQYAAADSLITITYYANNGTADSITNNVPKNSQITLAGAIFENAGSQLIGWSPAAGGEKEYEPNALFTTGETSLEFYAVWDTIGWTVKFEPTDGVLTGTLVGTGLFEAIADKTEWGTYFDGEAHSVPTVTPPTGYYFDGWSPAFPASIEKNETFYAVFKPKAAIALTANSDNAKVYNGTEQSVSGYNDADYPGLTFMVGEAPLTAGAKGTDATTYTAAFNATSASQVRVIEDGKDVTDKYTVALHTGTLTINKVAITIRANSYGPVDYDGAEHKAEGYAVYKTGTDPEEAYTFPAGHVLSGVSAYEARTQAATYPVALQGTAEITRTLDGNTTNATGNYIITTEGGTLIINRIVWPTGEKAVVHVTPYDDVYDALAHNITVTAPSTSTIYYSLDKVNYYLASEKKTEFTNVTGTATDTPIAFAGETVYFRVEDPNYTNTNSDLNGHDYKSDSYVRITPRPVYLNALPQGTIAGVAPVELDKTNPEHLQVYWNDLNETGIDRTYFTDAISDGGFYYDYKGASYNDKGVYDIVVAGAPYKGNYQLFYNDSSMNISSKLTVDDSFKVIYKTHTPEAATQNMPADSAPVAATEAGTDVALVFSPAPTYPGLTFLGWTADPTPGVTTLTYTAGSVKVYKANVTLYAVWKVDPNAFEFVYEFGMTNYAKVYDAQDMTVQVRYIEQADVPTPEYTVGYTNSASLLPGNVFNNVVDTTVTATITVAGLYSDTLQAQATITQRPVNVTVASAPSQAYTGYTLNSGNVAVTYQAEDAENKQGLVAGHTASPTAASTTGEAVGSHPITVAQGAIAVAAGSQAISSGNYAFNITPGNFEITAPSTPSGKLDLLFSLSGTEVFYNGQQQTWSGADAVALNALSVPASLKGGQASISGVTASASGTNAGSYPVVLDGSGLKVIDKNGTDVSHLYEAKLTPGQDAANLVIKPLEVTITPTGPLSKAINTDDPDWTTPDKYTITALPATIGDAQKPQFTIARDSGEAVGTYAVNVVYDATSAVNSNYTIAAGTNVFNIVAGTGLSGSAPDVTATYDGKSHGIVVTVNLPAGATGTPVIYYSTGAGESTTQPDKINVKDSGTVTYRITLEGYADFTGKAKVTINARAITLKANSYTKKAEQKDPAFKGSITKGRLMDDNDLGKITYGLKNKKADTSLPGTYDLTPYYTKNANYKVTVVLGALEVKVSQDGEPADPDDPYTTDPGTGLTPPTTTPTPGPVVPEGEPDGPVDPAPTPDPADTEPAEPDTSEPDDPDKSEPAPMPQQDPTDPTADFSGPVWALLNLILMILALVFSVILFVMIFAGRKKQEKENAEAVEGEEEVVKGKRGLIWRILAILMGVVSLIVFLLTENLSNPMVFVDTWTLLMVIISVAQIILMLVLRQVRQPKDEDEEQNNQAQA